MYDHLITCLRFAGVDGAAARHERSPDRRRGGHHSLACSRSRGRKKRQVFGRQQQWGLQWVGRPADGQGFAAWVDQEVRQLLLLWRGVHAACGAGEGWRQQSW